jgi:hypothetical protein
VQLWSTVEPSRHVARSYGPSLSAAFVWSWLLAPLRLRQRLAWRLLELLAAARMSVVCLPLHLAHQITRYLALEPFPSWILPFLLHPPQVEERPAAVWMVVMFSSMVVVKTTMVSSSVGLRSVRVRVIMHAYMKDVS